MGKISTMLALDGEANFRRQLNLINANLKTLEKELNATATQFTVGSGKMQQQTNIAANYSKQLEFLAAKEDLLKKAVADADRQINENRNKLAQSQNTYNQLTASVNTVKNAIETAKKVYGENSAEVRNLNVRLKELETQQKTAKASVNAAEKAVTSTANAYHRYRQQLADTRTAINKVNAEQIKNSEVLETTRRKFDLLRTVLNTTGNVLKTIPADFDKITNAAKKAGDVGIKGFETSLKTVNAELSAGVKGVETYVGALASAGTAVVGFATSQGMSFEEAMSKVKAYRNATDEEMARLTSAAKQTGATTTKTATEAAEALGYLALNGYSTEEMLMSLNPVVKASEAGKMDLAMAANYTASTLKSYGKEISETDKLLNIMTATQNNSATSLEELFMAYSESAGSFRTLNVGMEESATILGILADQGVRGSEAGAALNSILINLAGGNKKAKTALNDTLGVNAWEDGEFIGLTKLIQKIGDALESATQEQEFLIEAAIGGKTRFQELQKLISGVNNEAEYMKVNNPITTAFEDKVLYSTAETMMDNLKGRVTLLTSATSALGQSIYETFAEDATSGVEKFTHWVNILDEGVKKGTTGGMYDAISAVSSGASTQLSKGLERVAKDLPGNLKIFNKFIVEGARLSLQALSESKDTLLPELITGATDLVLELADFMPELTEDIADGAETLFFGIIDGFEKTTDKLVENGTLDKLITEVCDFFSEDSVDLFEAGLSIVGAIGQGIEDHAEEIGESAKTVLTRLVTDFADKAPEILEDAGSVVGTIVGVLTEEENLIKLTDAAVDIISSLATFIDENIDEIIEECDRIADTISERLRSEENKQKMLEAGKDLGLSLLKGVGSFLLWTKKELNRPIIDMFDGTYQADVLSDIDKIMRSDSNVKSAEKTSGYDSSFVGPVPININFNDTKVTGYNDVQSMADVLAQAIADSKAGGGRGK
jgi:TP901 family phage tail tape measure protein